jgi:hypothetical protein
MKYYNTPECCFEGVVEDGTAYKFGSYTKEESDERYASKETEEKVKTLEQQLKNKVDKADFDGFKQETESKNAETREIISEMSASVGAKLNELESEKANKNGVYTKEETDNKFATNADVLELIEETDVKKANKSEVYTKAEVDERIKNNNLGLIVQNGLLCVKYESEGV